jgi:hypothetical protein
MLNLEVVAGMYGLRPEELEPYGVSILRDDLTEIALFLMKRPFEALVMASLDAEGTIKTTTIEQNIVREMGGGGFDSGASIVLSHLIETDLLGFILDPDEVD